jgi:hypothetical protein
MWGPNTEPRQVGAKRWSPLTWPPFVPLVLGLLIRYTLAPYTADSNDVSVWYRTSLSGFYGRGLYDHTGFSYPPVWGYALQLLGAALRLAGVGASFFGVDNPGFLHASVATRDFSTTVTSPAFNLLFKSILFGIDVAVGLLIYRLVYVLTRKRRRANLGLALWFLNPLVIFMSAVHGAFDVMAGLSVLATIALVLEARPFWSGTWWVVGILTKVAPASLGLQLLVALTRGGSARYGGVWARLGQLLVFAAGAAVASVCLIGPTVFAGSLPGMVHDIFARTQISIAVGGVSIFGIRHFKEWSWVFLWAYQNSPLVVRVATLAQITATFFWAGWTLFVAREFRAFGLLAGTVGTLASITLLSPFSNPPYVLWWLPTLVVLVCFTERGIWQLFFLSVAPLVFALAILGPAAYLAPLATYTHLVPSSAIGDSVIHWYQEPGRLWGATHADDFFAPAAAVTVASLLSLFVLWTRMAVTRQLAPDSLPS